MIGQGREVERPTDLDVFTGPQRGAGFSFGESISCIHIQPVTEKIGITGDVGVDVKIAEIHVVQWICGLRLERLIFRAKESLFILCSTDRPDSSNFFLSRRHKGRL